MSTTTIQTIIPKEITNDLDGGDIQHASFGYYDGIEYAKQNNLKQTTTFREVDEFTHFIVCCGDVMVRVKSTDYPDIPRRQI